MPLHELPVEQQQAVLIELRSLTSRRAFGYRPDHAPTFALGKMIANVPDELMEQINARLFMVITTQ